MTTRIILLPGMGADHRLFDGIDLPGREVLRTDWIPHRDGEHLSAYAERFAAHYAVVATDILLGVSMGGIVAGVIAQRVPPQRLILVSSCTDIRQLSPILAVLSPIGRISPFEVGRWLPRVLFSPQRQMARTMLDAHDMSFLRWSCGAVMEWSGAPRLPGTVTIHGSADRVFPIQRQPQVEVTIRGGGHLMIMDRSAEVSEAVLANLSPPIRLDEG